MIYQHNESVTIIDAKDLHQGQFELLSQPPRREDRIDYQRIEHVAKWAQPEVTLKPRIELFDFERGAGLDNNPFYQWAKGRGYILHLTPYGPERHQEYEARLLARLRNLSNDAHSPVVFVCGACTSVHVREQLLTLAEKQSEVHIVHFGQRSEFQQHELECFASVRDLVEIGAAGPHHYLELSETTPAEPASDRSHLERIATPPLRDRDAIGIIGHAFAEQAPSLLARLESEPEHEPELPAEAQIEPAETSVTCFDDEPEPWLVVIDVENIDAVLFEILSGTCELNTETRVQWRRLLDWTHAEQSIEDAHVVPVLQATSPAAPAFASHLAWLGFRPVVLEMDPERKVVDEAIMKLLEDMQTRYGNVMLISNDGDFYDHLEALSSYADGSERLIRVAGFVDRMSQKYRRADWIETLDLERDLELFNYRLPNRYLPLSVDEFDAAALLNESSLFEEFEAA